MQVEPTCYFCQGKMIRSGTREIYRGNSRNREIIGYLYLCKSCHSEQCFATNGELMEYEFMIDIYRLIFRPKEHRFKIMKYPGGRLRDGKTILDVQTCPHLTPQNTTLEKIKLLVLFS